MLPSAGKPSCTHGYDCKCISDADRGARRDATQLPVNLARRARNQTQNIFVQMWCVQKRHNPHLSLVLSNLNPLRALLPAVDWKTTNTANRPFPKAGWNFRRPLSPPAEWRTRKGCDAAGERLSVEVFFKGGLRYHCRVCNKDSLLKRLLLVRHWAAKTDAMLKSAASRTHDDDETINGPDTVFPRDLDDFDSDDGDWDERPLIDYRSPTPCYPLRLF
ncbi:hypothetical protein C8R45DRAFT_1220982 [Mycena sanguinolenta]|nr:hypothetical protein C8R45DRAFT_1220982 [Mycena sanguinolenta]